MLGIANGKPWYYLLEYHHLQLYPSVRFTSWRTEYGDDDVAIWTP